MRITSLTLDAWGGFADTDVPLGSAGAITILHGPNEAGKSTLVRAIAAALFGTTLRQTEDAWRVKPAQLQVRAAVEFDDGTSFTFVRTRRKSPNDLLDAETMEPLDAARRQRLAGVLNGIDRATWDRRFGLDHSRLRDGGEAMLGSGGDLAETLAAAASGISTLRPVLDQIREQRDIRFNPDTGRRGSIPKLVTTYNEVSRELAAERAGVDELHQLRTTRVAYQNERAQLEMRTTDLQRKLTLLEHTRTAAAFLAEWDALIQRKQEAGDPPQIPTHVAADVRVTISQLREAIQQQSLISTQISSLTKRHDELTKAAAAAPIAARIQPLVQRIDSYRRSMREIGQAPSETGDRDETTATMSPQDRTDLDVAVRAAQSLERTSLLRDAANAEQLARDCAQAASDHAALIGAPAELAFDVARCAELKSAAERTARETAALESQIAEIRSRIDIARNEAAAAAAVLTSLGIDVSAPANEAMVARARAERDEQWALARGAWEQGQWAPDIEAAFVSSLHHADDAADEHITAAGAHERIRAERARHAQAHALLEQLDATGDALVSQLRAEIDHWNEVCARSGLNVAQGVSAQRFLEWVAAADGLRDMSRAAATAAASVSHGRADLVIRVERLTTALGLDPKQEVEPLQALDLELSRLIEIATRRIELDDRTLRERAEALQQERHLRERVRDARAECGEIEAAIGDLEHDAQQLGWVAGAEGDAKDVPARITALDQAARIANTAEQQLAAIQQQIDALNHAHQAAESEIEHALQQARMAAIAATLQPPSDATDAPALDVLEAACNATWVWQTIREDEHALHARIHAQTSPDAHIAQLMDDARSFDESTAHGATRSLIEELESCHERIAQIGHGDELTLQRIGAIEQSDRRQELLQTRESTRALIVRDVEAWAPLQLATALLDATIDAWRDAHGSPLLKRASQHFSQLTTGRYIGLDVVDAAAPGEQTRLVGVQSGDSPFDRESVELAAMSEGTRDQVFLALRIASIEIELDERGESLPVIFDDILVTSDPTRTAAALRAMSGLASRTQVILLTHSPVVQEAAALLEADRVFLCDINTLSSVVQS